MGSFQRGNFNKVRTTKKMEWKRPEAGQTLLSGLYGDPQFNGISRVPEQIEQVKTFLHTKNSLDSGPQD